MTASSEADGRLVVECPAPGVLRLVIDRARTRNAIDEHIRSALYESITDAAADSQVRAIILTGADGNFSAGGDLASMEGLQPDAALARMREGQQLMRALTRCRKPVVSAVEGVAVGAAVGLALAGDGIVADESARISFPFSRIGLVPDYGIATTLAGRVGSGRARQILLRGMTVTVEDALAMGLIDELTPRGRAQEAALNLAVELASRSSFSIGQTKAMLADPRVDEALEWETGLQALALVSPDAAEGRVAFRERRTPYYGPPR